MSFLTPNLVGTRNYARELGKTIETQSKYAPLQLQTEMQVQPFESAQTLANLNDFLNGTAAMDLPQYTYNPPFRPKKKSGGGLFGGSIFEDFLGGPLAPTRLGNLFGGSKGGGKGRLGGFVQSGTTHRAAQRGFLDLYNSDIIPSMLKAQTAQRQGDINDVMNLGPQARAALRASDPDAAALLDQLYGQSSGDLAAGASLNPSELRNIQQATRAGQAARGQGFGPNDTFQEAYNSLGLGQQLQNQRRGFAGDVLGQLQNFYGSPFSQILNRNSTAGQAQGQSAQALMSSKLGNFLNPESQYANNLYGNNADMTQGVENSRASANQALIGGIMSMVGSIGGGAISNV